MNRDDAVSPKGRKAQLQQLDIELTERCNNNCIHCFINLPEDDQEAKKKELSTEELKILLREAASLGCLDVRLTGGEPLLRNDFEEIYEFTRRLGIRVLIFTNARLITPRLADLLSRIPPLEKIEVTLYGMRRESYEAVTRIPGSFEEAWRGVNLLLEKNIAFIVKNTLLPPNKNEIEEFERWAAAIPWMDRAPHYSVLIDLHARRNEEKNKTIQKLRTSPAEILKHYSRNKKEYVEEMKEFCSKFASLQGTGLFACGAGKKRGCVDSYGRFQLCLALRHPETTYDLKSGSLQDALLNFFPKICNLKALNKKYIERCARCFLAALCEQCPAKSWMENGSLDIPAEYFCRITHEQARYAGLLNNGENSWEVEDWQERIKIFSKKKHAKMQEAAEGRSFLKA